MKTNAPVLVLVGSETTATLLSGTTFYLFQDPRVPGEATTEVRSTFASSPDITIDSVSRLHYLLAVLTETTRICLPAPAPLVATSTWAAIRLMVTTSPPAPQSTPRTTPPEM